MNPSAHALSPLAAAPAASALVSRRPGLCARGRRGNCSREEGSRRGSLSGTVMLVYELKKASVVTMGVMIVAKIVVLAVVMIVMVVP